MIFIFSTYNDCNGLKKLIKIFTEKDKILVHDNTLSDKFLKICKPFKNISYHKNFPYGAVNNWNNALKKTKKRFVNILHDDEFFHKNDFDKLRLINKKKNCVYILQYKVYRKKKNYKSIN